MRQTFFHDFKRDNGDPVTVEYSYSPGSETTYSPHSGAHGGDACEVEIVTAWPNTPEYNEMVRHLRDLEDFAKGKGISFFLGDSDYRDECHEVREQIGAADEACRLTDNEMARMTEWLMEHHAYEPSEQDLF